VDLDYPPEIETLRDEVRAFIAAKMPRIRKRAGIRSPEPEEIPAIRRWTADLFEAGYLGAHWPREFGGSPGRDPLVDFVIEEELALADAPSPIGAFGLAAGALIGFGSPLQQRR